VKGLQEVKGLPISRTGVSGEAMLSAGKALARTAQARCGSDRLAAGIGVPRESDDGN
jgi:hypothetical protein